MPVCGVASPVACMLIHPCGARTALATHHRQASAVMDPKRVSEYTSQSASLPAPPTLPSPERIKVINVNESVDHDALDWALSCSTPSQSMSLTEVSLTLMRHSPKWQTFSIVMQSLRSAILGNRRFMYARPSHP
jgi:hypothetical protein